MSRFYLNRKTTVEECSSISIAFLKRQGYLCGFASGWIEWKNFFGEATSRIDITVLTEAGGGYMRLQYSTANLITKGKNEHDYTVRLVTTPCNYGGVRYWFVCPLSRNGVSCGRRAAKLYKPPGACYFGCRHCYRLSYASRNEARLGRIGALGSLLKASKQYEDLRKQMKRQTYQGKPTKKAKKLQALEVKVRLYLDMGSDYTERF